MDSSPSHPVIVGQVAGVFGIKGWLKIRSETEPLTNILQYSPWYLKINQQWRRFEVHTGQTHGKGLIAQLKGCTDRNQAEELVRAEIAIEAEQLPVLAENEFYWSDLIGLTVLNQQGQTLGTVSTMLPTGANDVLVVQGQGQEVLIPYVLDYYVLEIDLEQKTMLVDWPWDEDDSEQEEKG